MNRDLMSSFVMLAFSLYICMETLNKLPVGPWQSPGPGLWPLGAGIFLGGLSAANFFRSLRKRSQVERSPWYPKETWPRIVGVITALMIYTVLLDLLGFLIATFLLLIFLFRTPEPQRWIVALFGSALTALGTYGVFEKWLQAQLPKGPWGF